MYARNDSLKPHESSPPTTSHAVAGDAALPTADAPGAACAALPAAREAARTAAKATRAPRIGRGKRRGTTELPLWMLPDDRARTRRRGASDRQRTRLNSRH